ncbi:hypothetical protein Nepgr_011526 [Nepenthes gracilis]|uniref:Uncharacterized protein n=1 Tax=Nepenthes gracilis TaxID=150966 RepID=A0AAD3SFB1_NEPGR|nr:hypothetical protein Nepgr_011526 [Nepenthes gracilis]
MFHDLCINIYAAIYLFTLGHLLVHSVLTTCKRFLFHISFVQLAQKAESIDVSTISRDSTGYTVRLHRGAIDQWRQG